MEDRTLLRQLATSPESTAVDAVEAAPRNAGKGSIDPNLTILALS